MTDRIDGEAAAAPNWRLRIALVTILAIAVAVLVIWTWRDARPFGPLPFLGLPERIDLCGRSYDGGGQSPAMTVAEVRTIGGFEPVIVDPWVHPACVAGACTRIATDTPCHTVVYVRVGRDEIVGYDLQGGP